MEVHPDKFSVLPDSHFKMFMASVELGLNSYGIDITKLALDTIEALATHLLESVNPPALTVEAVQHFLKLVFKMLMLESFDMSMMDVASSCFLALISPQQEQYHMLVIELLKSQTVPKYKDRLTSAFNKLTPPSLPLILSPQSKHMFLENFDHFLMDVRGFLCIR